MDLDRCRSEVTELVIFDCDGVLVDSEPLAIRTDVAALAELGWTLTEDEVVEQFVGLSMTQMREKIESHLDQVLPRGWEEQTQRRLRDVFAAELRPVDGIVEALDAIRHKTCVASSGTHDKIEFSLKLTGLHARFRGRIFSATDVSRGKPAPDLFLHAAGQMNVAPSDCVVIEDSVPGVTAALAAGMGVLAYAGGVTPAARLKLPGAVLFDDMRDIPRLLLNGDEKEKRARTCFPEE